MFINSGLFSPAGRDYIYGDVKQKPCDGFFQWAWSIAWTLGSPSFHFVEIYKVLLKIGGVTDACKGLRTPAQGLRTPGCLVGWLAGWLPAQYGPKDACMCPPDACVAHFEAYHLWRDLSYRFRHTLSLFWWDLWSQSWYMAAFVSRLALRAVRVHPASKRVLQSRSNPPSWDFLKLLFFIYSLLQWFPSNSCTEGDLRTPAPEK